MGNWFSEPMKNEIPFSEIEKKSEEFHHWNFEPFSMQEIGYEGVMDELKEYTAERYESLDEEGKEKLVDEVLAIYRSVDLLPIQYYSELGVMNEIEKCISYKAGFDGDTVSCGAGIGTTLCNYLFPNIFDTPSKHDLDKKDAETLFKKFHNDQYLKRAIKFCFSYKNGCPTPTNVMGGLRLVGSAPTNFRPMNAKAIYERFCPEGGIVYDFCCVDGETEFFNGSEWKRIDKYVKGDKVLQYNADGKAELVEPTEYIKYSSDAMFYESDGAIPSSLTGNHDVVYISTGGYSKIKFDELMFMIKRGASYPIPMVCLYYSKSDRCLKVEETHAIVDTVISQSGEVNEYISEEEGCYHLTDEVFSLDIFSKMELLDKFGLGALSVTSTSDEVVLQVVGEENAKTLCTLYNMCGQGRGRVFYKKDDGFANRYNIIYSTLDWDEYDYYSVLMVKKKMKYCFVVPSHMLVLRRKGVMFITGNCGFGGRLLGCLSSKKNFRYVGTDPCTETMYHLHELGDYIEMVTGREDSFELHCCGSEEFRGPAESVDFAFSSPPYFDLEVYSNEETQCFNKFPVLEEWLEGYVRATIKNIYHMLKRGAVYAVNIADFTVGGSKTVAYVDEWIRISTEEGMPLYDTVYLGVTARAGSAQQAAGELKKENILIFKKPL